MGVTKNMLTVPVKQYVPRLAYGDSVKIINLLSHTSALKAILNLRTHSMPVVKKAIALYNDVLHRYVDEYKLLMISAYLYQLRIISCMHSRRVTPKKTNLRPESETKFLLKGPK